MMHLTRQWMVLAIGAVLVSIAQANAEDPFAEGHREYTAGNYKQAAVAYETAVKNGSWSAPLFYNLGNTCFQLHDFGRAILNYERALALEPNHPEAATNLRIARDEAHALELAPDWQSSALRFARPAQYAVTACVIFWAGAFLLARAAASQPRRKILLSAGVFLLLLAGFLVFLVASIENGGHGRGLAIVTDGVTEARVATADTAANVLTLPAGSEIKVEQKRGDWAYALLPNGMHGWVAVRQLELVRL